MSFDGRVVKATDLKSVGVSPRRFKSCSKRYFFSLVPISFFTSGTLAIWLYFVFDLYLKSFIPNVCVKKKTTIDTRLILVR